MKLAPILLFIYNRPDHAARTIEALKKNILAKQSDLIIFSDAPKDEKASNGVAAVRKYARTVSGFKSIKIIERKSNYGLAKSIIDGVTKIVNSHGRVIVVEDDLVTSKYFLQYMNDALNKYVSNNDVASISAYSYPAPGLPETFFIKGADCWGWATWKRAWKYFEKDGKKLLKRLEEKKLTNEFDFWGTYPYTKMLRQQIQGKNSSWAIRWYASAFLAGMLTLYPGKSLVTNIGTASGGTHSGRINKYFGKVSDSHVDLKQISVTEDMQAKKLFSLFFLYNQSIIGRILFDVVYAIKGILR
ncbi:MAG: glycosyltransferase [archaeon]